MNSGADKSEDYKRDMLTRLNRIEGQVRGIRRMIEEEKPCGEVLTQISAVRAAANKVGVMLIERYSKECMLNSFGSEELSKEEMVEEFLATVQKFLKFAE
jgi:DNA-binding FrmR family transcriptional regulator